MIELLPQNTWWKSPDIHDPSISMEQQLAIYERSRGILFGTVYDVLRNGDTSSYERLHVARMIACTNYANYLESLAVNMHTEGFVETLAASYRSEDFIRVNTFNNIAGQEVCQCIPDSALSVSGLYKSSVENGHLYASKAFAHIYYNDINVDLTKVLNIN